MRCRLTIERQGGARNEVPNGTEVDPTKLWTLVLAALLLSAYAGRFVLTVPHIM